MKFAKYIMTLLLAFPAMAMAGTNIAAELLLSGNDIDLLVGAPVGIAEPLDQRRTRHDPINKQDFSEFLEDDLSGDLSFNELDWSDAEDAQVSDDQAESQLLDLLSETEELEKSDSKLDDAQTDNDDAISFDNIETDLKL